LNHSSSHHPPKLAVRFLLWFLKGNLAEEVLGDLDEKFYATLENESPGKAKRNYWFQVFNYLRPFAFKKHRHNPLNYPSMFKHNLLISFRSFYRFKTTFAINLLGLASGLASALLIYLWVNDELKTDQFKEKDSDRHVQVIHTYPTSGTFHTNTSGSTPNPLYSALAEKMPEVDYSFPVMAAPENKGILSYEDNTFRAQYQFIGEGYFNVFPGNFLHGDKYRALADKGNIAISDKLALTLFQSTEAAMGKVVSFKDPSFGGAYQVAGVFKSEPKASEKFDILFNYDLYIDLDLMQWYNGSTQAHLVLNEGVDLEAFNAKIKSFLLTIHPNWKDILYAQPYSEKYLYGQYEQGIPVAGRILYVRLFAIIALFVLVIACINYMNFSTAKASRRVKEIGIKKAIGANRSSLIFQYFSESMTMAFLSLTIALVLVVILLPQFNEITGKQLVLSLTPEITIAALCITGLTGLASGIYPALYLSGFKSVLALKGKLKTEVKGLWLRKSLVIFQFAISVILTVSVIVIYNQVEYIQSTHLGYDRDHIITFSKEGELATDSEAFFTELNGLPGVVKASQMSGDLPGRIGYSQGFKWEGMEEEDRRLRFYLIRGGYDLIELLGIKLKAGRDFSKDLATDRDAIIMNQTAIDMIGLKAPIGAEFGNLNPNAPTKTIIGVVENFHFESFQENVKPFFFALSDEASKFIVKLNDQNRAETIAKIADLYESHNAGYPFEYKFLDDDYQALYASEERITALSKYFTGIAIGISCLGLLALTAFNTQRRFKEIAIRKVLGSSNLGIVKLLSNGYLLLVLMAIVIALPVSYLIVRRWLDNFAYRIQLDPTYFIVAGALMLLMAWLTIVSQTARSARVKVTESLKGD